MASVEFVRDHFDVWSEDNKNDKVVLLETSELEDGRVIVKIQIDLYEIKLFVPDGYPKHEEGSNFYIEGPATVGIWCNSLNEFLLDNSDKKLLIPDVLHRIVNTYVAKPQYDDYNQSVSSEDDHTEDEMVEDIEGEDDDDENEMFIDDMLSDDDRIFTTDWELATTRMKIQWRAKEAKLREEMAKNESSNSVSSKYKSDRVKQIFSNPAASAILANDLITVMEHEKVTGITSQPIEDNIFKWIVKLNKFSESSVLAQDLQELNKTFNYDYIELRMEFDMDLYPFYPPVVKVIRPRIKGINNENLTSFDFLKLFQLSNWNPTSNMKDILEKVKDFLQNYCRLNLESYIYKNDPKKYLDGAYYDVEHSLLRLSVVSETAPRGARNNPPSYPGIQSYLPPTPSSAPNNSNQATSSKIPSKSSKKELKTEHAEKFSSLSAPSSPLLLPAFKNLAKSKHLLGYSSSSCIKKAKELTSKKNAAGVHKDFWAKGTGYGSYRHPSAWDVNAYVAAQKEKDRQLEIVLSDILEDLRKEFSKSGPQTFQFHSQEVSTRRSSSGEESSFSSDWSISNSSNGSSGAANYESTTDEDIYNILEGSALIPFLERHLSVDSFLEVSRHVGLYRVIISIVGEIAKQRTLVRLLTSLPDQRISIYSLLQELSKRANFIINHMDKVAANGCIPGMSHLEQDADSSEAESNFLKMCSGRGVINKDKAKNKNLAEEKIARTISSLFKTATESLKRANLLPDEEENSNQSDEDEGMDCGNSSLVPLCQPSTSESSLNSEEALSQIYRKCLKPLQFESWKTEGEGPKGHHYASKFKPGLISQQQILRVAQELSSLASSLPLDLASSIFVRTDEEKILLMRALIIGPEGTPYSNGCFVFDIFFPNNYPKTPPMVHFQTTGAGTVRFNPNLYNTGKVCLSLLGTWNGVQGEQWTEMSTVLQVLVSIQSLILVQDPYFNEPGYESFIGTAPGKIQSDNYNHGVKLNNIKYAMIDQLQNPCPGFEEVIKAHFFIKKKKIIEEIDEWAKECPSKLQSEVTTLKRMLRKLEAPNEDVAKLTNKL